MSEFAQQRLEKLLPVFEELQRVQLFTNEEVKAIIKKCKSFEYRLEKRAKSKDDYVKYIQYLIYLLALIRERRQDINYFYKKKEIDYAIGSKIELIFRIACGRFQADVNMWLSRIEFAKTQQLHVSVSQIFMRLLQIHTDKPYLWIAAAKWEFEENGSAESARSLLQRGLRFNVGCKKLYLELFRLELLYVEKLRQRNEALQLSEAKAVIDDNETATPAENGAPSEDVSDAVLQGQLARIVFVDAAETFEGDVDLCIQFARIAREFTFAHDLVDYIYNFIQQQYPDIEETYTTIAERQYFENPFDLDACKETFEKALERFQNGAIWRQYIRFYLNRLDENCPNRPMVLEECLSAFSRAEAAEETILDEDLYNKWISLCDSEKSKAEIADKALKRFPKSAPLWECCLTWKILSSAAEKEVMKTFNSAVKALPEKETLPLWEHALNWAIIACPERVGSIFEASHVLDLAVSGPMKIKHLVWISTTKDAETFRCTFRRFCTEKPNSVEFYLEYYKLEQERVQPHLESIRFCFEQALFEHGTKEVRVWLAYARFELKDWQGDPGRASQIYERAIKKLEDEKVEEFVREYLLLTKE